MTTEEVIKETERELTAIFESAIEARDAAQVVIKRAQNFKARLTQIQIELTRAELDKQ